jgi:hypothetical protein
VIGLWYELPNRTRERSKYNAELLVDDCPCQRPDCECGEGHESDGDNDAVPKLLPRRLELTYVGDDDHGIS